MLDPLDPQGALWRADRAWRLHQQPPARAAEFQASAEVIAIDPGLRLVTLRREDGSLFQVRAGNEVRNFDQIATGDHLRVRFLETLAVSRRPEGESAKGAEGALAVGRAEAGAKPAGAVGRALSVRVKIESIDRERSIVVLSLASGELVSHRVATKEGREFLTGVKIGDTVQIDYTEALALSIEKL
jgi:hypothetical protein